MVDQRFHHSRGPFNLRAIIDAIEEEQPVLEANFDDDSSMMEDVSPLKQATEQDVSFLDNAKYIADVRETKAGVVLISEKRKAMLPPHLKRIVVRDPYRAYARVASLFYPIEQPTQASIHPTAVLGTHVVVEDQVVIEAGVVIGSHVMIGRGTRIGANSVIGAQVSIGRSCMIGAQVTISHAMLGDRVEILPGVRIGQDGFGFAMGKQGHKKVPQLGRVIIQDDVSIGANSCIDRGSGPDTVIGEGTKLDNLVQIGHNVHLGRHVVVAGMGAVAGSTFIDDFVAIGGQAAINGHIRVGKGAQIAGASGVMRDVKPGAKMAGFPATDVRSFFKMHAFLKRFVKGDKSDE